MHQLVTLCLLNAIAMIMALNIDVLPSYESHPWFQPTGYLLVIVSFIWGLLLKGKLQHYLTNFKYSPPIFFLIASIVPGFILWFSKVSFSSSLFLIVFTLFTSVILTWLHIGLGVAVTGSIRKNVT